MNRKAKIRSVMAALATIAAGGLASGGALAGDIFGGGDAGAYAAQGYIGARYGGLWSDGSSQLIDEKTAAAAVRLGPGFLQVEGRAAGFFFSGAPENTALAAGHFYLRNEMRAIGFFGGFEVYPSGNLIFQGFEAQAFLGAMVPYGQVAYAHAADSGDSAWWVRAGLRYFLTDNRMLQGDIRYMGGVVNSWLFSADFEFRPGGKPVAWRWTANYQTGVGGGDGSFSFLGGINIHLGNGSLRQAYTTGAVWNLLPVEF